MTTIATETDPRTSTNGHAAPQADALAALRLAHHELSLHPVSHDNDVRRAREACESAIAQLEGAAQPGGTSAGSGVPTASPTFARTAPRSDRLQRTNDQALIELAESWDAVEDRINRGTEDEAPALLQQQRAIAMEAMRVQPNTLAGLQAKARIGAPIRAEHLEEGTWSERFDARLIADLQALTPQAGPSDGKRLVRLSRDVEQDMADIAPHVRRAEQLQAELARACANPGSGHDVEGHLAELAATVNRLCLRRATSLYGLDIMLSAAHRLLTATKASDGTDTPLAELPIDALLRSIGASIEGLECEALAAEREGAA